MWGVNDVLTSKRVFWIDDGHSIYIFPHFQLFFNPIQFSTPSLTLDCIEFNHMKRVFTYSLRFTLLFWTLMMENLSVKYSFFKLNSKIEQGKKGFVHFIKCPFTFVLCILMLLILLCSYPEWSHVVDGICYFSLSIHVCENKRMHQGIERKVMEGEVSVRRIWYKVGVEGADYLFCG